MEPTSIKASRTVNSMPYEHPLARSIGRSLYGFAVSNEQRPQTLPNSSIVCIMFLHVLVIIVFMLS